MTFSHRPVCNSGMRYQRSFTFLFQSHHWPSDLLAGACCIVIPLVGWVLLIGYLIEVSASLLEHSDEDYPAFELDRVGDYLDRGLRPGLAQLVALLPIILIGCMGGWIGSMGSEPGKGFAIAFKVIVAVAPLLFGLCLAVSLPLLPVTLFFGKLHQADEKPLSEFVLDFLKHVWREALLAQTFVLVTGTALLVCGLVPCGFGAPPALAIAGFSQYHLLAQLHALYLQRIQREAVPQPQATATSGVGAAP